MEKSFTILSKGFTIKLTKRLTKDLQEGLETKILLGMLAYDTSP